MHRRKLLDHLADYASRHPQESATTSRFIDFVADEPRCFERDCWRGHVTGSAWLMDPDEQALLLTHHRKLDIWVQLGGHSDGDPDTLAVACREAEEESGVGVEVIGADIFDLQSQLTRFVTACVIRSSISSSNAGVVAKFRRTQASL